MNLHSVGMNLTATQQTNEKICDITKNELYY